MADSLSENSEIARLSAELTKTQGKLEDERRKREEDLITRLDKLDAGQGALLKEMTDVKLTYATSERMTTLEVKQEELQGMLYKGLGGLAVLTTVVLPVVMFLINKFLGK